MIIALGNQAAIKRLPGGASDGIHDDGIPRVTYMHIPEWDDGSTHPDAEYDGPHPHEGAAKVGTLVKPGPRLGGYTHKKGLSVAEFNAHRIEAMDLRNGITRLPDHETLLTVVEAWKQHSIAPPTWLEVMPHPLTDQDEAADVERFLHEFWGTNGARTPLDLEERYWTKAGPPGKFPTPPPLSALFTDSGRVLQANMQGGGQVGVSGTGSAASSTSFTTDKTLTTNAWAGYRVYAFNGTSLVWANIKSNNNTASASVLTVDRWYTAATPGGSAGTTPASGYYYLIADGGSTSAWFMGLSSTSITPAHGDTSMSGEITTAGGGLIRKIATYILTSGTSPMGYTLAATFTANGSDSLPATVYAINESTSILASDTTNDQFFESLLNASATLTTSGDQVTPTDTVAGS